MSFRAVVAVRAGSSSVCWDRRHEDWERSFGIRRICCGAQMESVLVCRFVARRLAAPVAPALGTGEEDMLAMRTKQGEYVGRRRFDISPTSALYTRTPRLSNGALTHRPPSSDRRSTMS